MGSLKPKLPFSFKKCSSSLDILNWNWNLELGSSFGHISLTQSKDNSMKRDKSLICNLITAPNLPNEASNWATTIPHIHCIVAYQKSNGGFLKKDNRPANWEQSFCGLEGGPVLLHLVLWDLSRAQFTESKGLSSPWAYHSKLGNRS